MNELKRRFVDDFKIPITVFEEPYWSFQISLFEKEFKSQTSWARLLEGIENEYNGSVEKFLGDFYSYRESLIQSIHDSEAFDLLKNLPPIPKTPEIDCQGGDNIYNEARIGKSYVSIDLRKANIQALMWISDKFFDSTRGEKVGDVYKRWLLSHMPEGKELLEWYVSESKYLRQVILGNCNAKSQIKVEKYLIKTAGLLVHVYIPDSKIIQVGSDEMILEVPGKVELDGIEDLVLRELKIDVKIENFKLSSIEFLTKNGHSVRVYKKTDHHSGNITYKGIQRQYYSQIYELLNGLEPDPERRDVVFYYEKEPAMFIGRLTMVGENGN